MVDYFLAPGYPRGKKETWWNRHRHEVAVAVTLLVVGLGAGFGIGWASKPISSYQTASVQQLLASSDHAAASQSLVANSFVQNSQPIARRDPTGGDVWRLASEDYEDGISTHVVDFIIYVRDSLPPMQSKAMVASTAEELRLVDKFFKKHFMAFWQSQHAEVLKLLRRYSKDGYAGLDALLADPETSKQAFDLFEAIAWYSRATSGEDLPDDAAPEADAQWAALKAQFERDTAPPPVIIYDQEPWQMLLLKEQRPQARATAYLNQLNLSRTSESQDAREPFPLVTVPVVFHVLQYKNGSAGALPNWEPESFQHLLEGANAQLDQDGANMRLTLAGVRDASNHSYLLLPSAAAWQACGQPAMPGQEQSSRELCLSPLAKANNADVARNLNVYVSGSYLLPGGGDLASGFTNLGGSVGEAARDQYIWMRYDGVDPSLENNEDAFEAGVGTLLEQFGHYMGLYKTHRGGCEDRDLIADTAPNKDMVGEAWRLELDAWCQGFQREEKWVEGGKILAKFSSCHAAQSAANSPSGAVDNLFNFMSNTPPACRMYFTLQQVQRMQVVLKMLRRVMYTEGRN